MTPNQELSAQIVSALLVCGLVFWCVYTIALFRSMEKCLLRIEALTAEILEWLKAK